MEPAARYMDTTPREVFAVDFLEAAGWGPGRRPAFPRPPAGGTRGPPGAVGGAGLGGCRGGRMLGPEPRLGNFLVGCLRVPTVRAPFKLGLSAAPSPFGRGARLGKWLPTGSTPEPPTWPEGLSGDTEMSHAVRSLPLPTRQNRGSASAWRPLGSGPPSPGEGAPPGWGHPRGASGPPSPVARAPGTLVPEAPTLKGSDLRELHAPFQGVQPDRGGGAAPGGSGCGRARGVVTRGPSQFRKRMRSWV